MLTRSFVVSEKQQEIIVRYKPFLSSWSPNNCHTSIANLVVRGRRGFFRYTPQFHITAKIDERDRRTHIILRVSPNFPFGFILLFCVIVAACSLATIISRRMMNQTASLIFLLFPLSVAILDVLELWWQTTDCLNRLQEIATRQGDG